MIRIIGVGDNVIDCNYTKQMMYPGGNSFNFAMYGRQLGHMAAYAGTIAKDWQGEVITRTLREAGVDISRCQYVEGETGICGIHLADGDRTIVDENDAGVVKSNPFVISDEMLEYLKDFDIIHTCCYGHLQPQLFKLKQTGVPVLYDFSDEWEAETLKHICPSIEIAFFSGKELTEETLTEYLLQCVNEYGCKIAVTTIGIRGALIYNGRKIYKKLPYNAAAAVADTTGAGDSWITAFMTTYLEGKKNERRLYEDKPENFTREEDRYDYEDRLIEFSMCAGNLLARRNCLIDGSVGHGIKFGERR